MRKIIITILIALSLTGCSKQEKEKPIMSRFSEQTQLYYADEEMDVVSMDYLISHDYIYIDKYVIVKDVVTSVNEIKSPSTLVYVIGEHELTFFTETNPGVQKGEEGYFLLKPFESPLGTLYAVHDVGK